MTPSPKKSNLDGLLDKCEDLVAGILLSAHIVKFEEGEMAVFTEIRDALTDSLMSIEQANQAIVLIRQVFKLVKDGKIQLTEAQQTVLHSVLDEIRHSRYQIKQLTNE